MYFRKLDTNFNKIISSSTKWNIFVFHTTSSLAESFYYVNYELRCQNELIFLKTPIFVFHYQDYLINFWCNNWWSIIEIVEILCFCLAHFGTNWTRSLHNELISLRNKTSRTCPVPRDKILFCKTCSVTSRLRDVGAQLRLQKYFGHIVHHRLRPATTNW